MNGYKFPTRSLLFISMWYEKLEQCLGLEVLVSTPH